MTNENLNTSISNIKEALKYPELFQNTSNTERVLSGVVGTYLLVKGITNIFTHPIVGFSGAAIGVGLLYRGYTGFCPIRDLNEQRRTITVTETF